MWPRQPGGRSAGAGTTTSTRRCSWRPWRWRSTVSARSTGARPAHRARTASCRRGWLALTRASGALPVAAARAKVFLTVQGVDREDDAAEAQVLDHRLHRLDLRGHLRHLLVGKDQRRAGGEGAEHVGRRTIVQPIEAAPQRLAIEGYGTWAVRGGSA